MLDIFAFDFVIVPVHDHLHWSLLIICHPGSIAPDSKQHPCMLHLDSMNSAP